MDIGERMIAERQREVEVSLRALRMMQGHYGNRFIGFKCVRPEEEAEWIAKAEKVVPAVTTPERKES